MTDGQREADLERVSQQNSLTDFARNVGDGQRQGLLDRMIRSTVGASTVGRAVQHRTDFEGRTLNEMVDLVDNADPQDLASSGRALWDARQSILVAAAELDGHITNVEWAGEAGEAFRTWGCSLVTSTEALGEFAGAAADQITAAATGLASVRSAMPRRDADPNRKRPDEYTDAEKTAKRDEYTAAVKVERDRQEAINQMNRLSSYYAVSEEVLASLEAPEFKAMPDVGVPEPVPKAPIEYHGGRASSGAGAAHVSDRSTSVMPDRTPDVKGTIGVPAHEWEAARRISYPAQNVSTTIDTVATPPIQTSPSSTGPAQSPLPPTAPGPGIGNGLPPGYVPPVANGLPSRTPTVGGVRPPAFAQGKTGAAPTRSTPTPGRVVGQGVANPEDRPATVGQSAARSTPPAGPATTAARGITGGTPRVGGPTPRAGGGTSMGTGQTPGVIGGRPMAAPGSSSAPAGARIPRGTVIGAEGAPNAPRSEAGQSRRRGVVGAPESTSRARPRAADSRVAVRPTDRVTGSRAAHNSVAEAERNGMTRGGAGLVRGASGGLGVPASKDGTRGGASRRPGCSAEDEETRLSDRSRRDVPPVIN
ncbi:hypothetical protein [Streptomyces sp. bgisy154]|uniref:hypothetical protein n=1 Tax=Streptomyces sp. bgisy154 TaxID=3413794 RepID=UPI003D73831E